MELRSRGWSIMAAAREVVFPARQGSTGRAVRRSSAMAR
jgi:hypothetical protein